MDSILDDADKGGDARASSKYDKGLGCREEAHREKAFRRRDFDEGALVRLGEPTRDDALLVPLHKQSDDTLVIFRFIKESIHWRVRPLLLYSWTSSSNKF